MIGPKITTQRSCFDCEVCVSESYRVQSDSGQDVYCTHPSLAERKRIGDTSWETPDWCPAAIAACADARITELETALTVRETEIARLETDLELARMDQARYRWLRSGERGMSGLSTVINDDCQPPYYELKCEKELDAAIDAARGGS